MSTSFDPTQRALPFFQEDGLRRKILAAYWIAVIIGLPLWWSTTSIIRLSLPEARVQALNALQTVLHWIVHKTDLTDLRSYVSP